MQQQPASAKPGHGFSPSTTLKGISVKAGAVRSAFSRHKKRDIDRSLPVLQLPTEDNSSRTSKSVCNATPSPPSTPMLSTPNISSQYRIAFQARNGCATLHEFDLTEHDPGPIVMRKLRAKAKEIVRPSRFFGFFLKEVIETAIVDPINGSDLERQIPLAINLRENIANPWLTQAFHDPETLDRSPDFTDFKIEGNTQNSEGNKILPMKTLVIRTSINKSVMLLLLLVTAVVACVIGILVGALTRKVELGFGVAGAVFALIAVLQGVVVAYMKELGGGGRG